MLLVTTAMYIGGQATPTTGLKFNPQSEPVFIGFTGFAGLF